MTQSLIEISADLHPLAGVIVESFQYPENEAWNVQTEEKEQLVDSIKNINCIWPLIRLIQA